MSLYPIDNVDRLHHQELQTYKHTRDLRILKILHSNVLIALTEMFGEQSFVSTTRSYG